MYVLCSSVSNGKAARTRHVSVWVPFHQAMHLMTILQIFASSLLINCWSSPSIRVETPSVFCNFREKEARALFSFKKRSLPLALKSLAVCLSSSDPQPPARCLHLHCIPSSDPMPLPRHLRLRRRHHLQEPLPLSLSLALKRPRLSQHPELISFPSSPSLALL